VRRLQSALFGGVYEAKGLTSNRDFAIKVLHKSELTKAQESSSIEFCEVPLSEIRFAELMRGHPHVMEPEEHFEDAYCFYVVFELARGGDLLEALKHKPHGFDEAHAQYLIKQAATGLAFLHQRHVAMQDVSLENFLLHVKENTGHYSVKVCDPGQAVIFDVDQDGEEMAVNFRGLVGKSFRPPELHEQQPYCATKVDSWCLGWSTFYLLTAQPLFMSADPAQQDSDWLLFQQGDFAQLFQQKCNLCSPTGLDFIFRLLQIEPRRRMSIADALNHPWLADQSIAPVLAPKDILAEMSMFGVMDNRPLEVVDGYDGDQVQNNANTQNISLVNDGGLSPSGGTSYSPPTGKPLSGMPYGQSNDLPTWAAAANPNQSGLFGGAPNYAPYSGYPADGNSMLRMPMGSAQRTRGEVRSPLRSPRSTRASGGPQLTFDGRIPFDRLGPGGGDGRERARYAQPPRMAHVISTAHSPAPQGRGSPPPRAGSPLQRQWSPSNINQNTEMGSGSYPTNNMGSFSQMMPQGQTSMLTPRSGSGRHSPGLGQSPLQSPMQSPLSSAVPAPNNQVNAGEDRSRGRAWAFRSNSPIRDESPAAPEYGRGARAASPFGNPSTMMRPGSATFQVPGAPSRVSPGPHSRFSAQGSSGGITFPRSLSPGLLEAPMQQPGSQVRANSPGASVRALSPNGNLAGSTRVNETSGAFNWSAAPPLSPRVAGGVSRIASPSGSHVGVSRIASPSGLKPAGGSAQVPTMFGQQGNAGFTWSPEPSSPRTSPRSYSPSPGGMIGSTSIKAGGSSLPRWPM